MNFSIAGVVAGVVAIALMFALMFVTEKRKIRIVTIMAFVIFGTLAVFCWAKRITLTDSRSSMPYVMAAVALPFIWFVGAYLDKPREDDKSENGVAITARPFRPAA